MALRQRLTFQAHLNSQARIKLANQEASPGTDPKSSKGILAPVSLPTLATAPAPRFERPGNAPCCCPVAEPKVYANRLIYGLNCRRIAVFDLDRLVLLYQLESPDYSGTRPLDAFGYSPSDVDSDKLFAVRSGNRSAVFDLTTGRRIALLPIDASGIAVREANMAAYLPAPSYDRRPIGIYRIDMAGFSKAPEKTR